MPPRYVLLLIGLLLVAPVAADNPGTQAQVDALFTEWSDPGQPGLAIGIIEDGELTYARGFGSANIEHEVPITPESVFYLASVGKQFTTFAIALLQQDGKLSVDDDIRQYVPEMPDYGAPITIRHLIHHTSGLRDYLALLGIAGLDLGTYHHDQPIVDMLARQKNLNFMPGERFLYSNSGYFLMAVIVERVSGQSLREFADERMFGPLGMANSHFHDDHTHPIKGRAMAYSTGEDGELDVFLSSFDRVGSGGVYGNIPDLVKWDQNFYSHEIGGQEVYDLMHTQGTLNDGSTIAYAGGLFIGEHRGLKTVSHGGSLGGYRTMLTRYPEQKFSVVILANLASINPTGLAEAVAEIHLADYMAPEAAPDPAGDAPRDDSESEWATVDESVLEGYAGLYYSEASALVRSIVLRDQQLEYSRGSWPGANSPLRARSTTEFAMEGTPITLLFDPETGQMIGKMPDEADMVFERIGGETTDQLQSFAGRYHSPEVDTAIDIEVTDGQLHVRHPADPDEKPAFTRANENKFVNLDLGALRFSRDSEGNVAGFELDTGRVLGIVFDRMPD